MFYKVLSLGLVLGLAGCMQANQEKAVTETGSVTEETKQVAALSPGVYVYPEECGRLTVDAAGDHRYRWGCGGSPYIANTVSVGAETIRIDRARMTNIRQTTDGFIAEFRMGGRSSDLQWVKQG